MTYCFGVTYQASRDQLEQAIVGAEQAFEITRNSPTYERVARSRRWPLVSRSIATKSPA